LNHQSREREAEYRGHLQVTAVFGFTLAGLVIQDTAARCASEKGRVRPA